MEQLFEGSEKEKVISKKVGGLGKNIRILSPTETSMSLSLGGQGKVDSRHSCNVEVATGTDRKISRRSSLVLTQGEEEGPPIVQTAWGEIPVFIIFSYSLVSRPQ